MRVIENCSLITVAEGAALNAEIEKICEEYKIPNSIDLEISRLMKLTAGKFSILLSHDTLGGTKPKAERIKEATIKLSYALYREFGFERIMKTLKHEMAHFVNFIVYNGSGHDRSFKKLCAKFGGTMNNQMAGYGFADCATKEYCQRDRGYRYTCPKCGSSHEKAHPWTPKKAKRYTCNRCKTRVSLFMMEEI